MSPTSKAAATITTTASARVLALASFLSLSFFLITLIAIKQLTPLRFLIYSSPPFFFFRFPPAGS
tara:strand:- start:236 stop:430 length:195 start_codon:yes stop_codon:yes gene_type:complete